MSNVGTTPNAERAARLLRAKVRELGACRAVACAHTAGFEGAAAMTD
jgi:hypothetical protein